MQTIFLFRAEDLCKMLDNSNCKTARRWILSNSPIDLNDDIVGRTRDAIHKYGSTELFNEITLQVMKQYSLGTQLIHIDTTNFSVNGEYEGYAPNGTRFDHSAAPKDQYY
jgi:transposase